MIIGGPSIILFCLDGISYMLTVMVLDILDPRAGAGHSRSYRNAITDFIRDDPYGGDALDAVKEEARRRELDEFTMIIVSPAAIDQI
jgi:hypothetical protein